MTFYYNIIFWIFQFLLTNFCYSDYFNEQINEILEEKRLINT